jgi:uncharacterized hydrophobic protein (TIGR00341 family)
MKYVEVIASAGSSNTILAIAEKVKAQDVRLGVVGEDGKLWTRLLVSDNKLQALLDILQNVLGAQPTASVVVLPVESALPKPDEEKHKEECAAIAVREALYGGVSRSAQLDHNYVVLVVLSTLVAAIGLIADNVAVVIGAMVIAPLLGPNLALSLGTALGDAALMRKASRTLVAGLLLAIGLSAAIGFCWPCDVTSAELSLRTQAGLDSVALALASGAAAALSLTTGLSSVLVGVMVAVALLPPAATLGLMLGGAHTDLAVGAGLLLAINIVCVNLASKVVFFVKGVRPRTWLEKETAKRTVAMYVAGWIVALLILIGVVYIRRSMLQP